MKKKVKMLIGIGAFSLCLVSAAAISGFVKADDVNEFVETEVTEGQLYNMAKECAEYSETVAEDDAEAQAGKQAEIVSNISGEDKNELKEAFLDEEKEESALVLAAKDTGISVSEREISEEIEVAKDALHDGAEGEKQLQAIVAGSGGDEEEYWESVRPVYAKNLLINKYITSEMAKLGIEESEMDNIDVINQVKEKLAFSAMKKYNIQ